MQIRRYIIDEYKKGTNNYSRVHCIRNHTGTYHYKCKTITWDKFTSHEFDYTCKRCGDYFFTLQLDNAFDICVNAFCKITRLNKMIIAEDNCPDCHPELDTTVALDTSKTQYEKKLKTKKPVIKDKQRRAEQWLQSLSK